ncbi:MAG: hypothetical protein IJ736_09140 [Firmicutes bacterium]|nr:hypothetical protein [Bacillota bacterium]
MVTKKVMNMCKAIEDMVDEGKIIGTIDTYRELGKKQEDAAKKIMSKFALTTEEANEYIVKYW